MEDRLKYGVVKKYKNYDLWYEPITDVDNGFVIRDKKGYIIYIFTKDE